MTASRLSDLTVDDFDEATDDLTVHGKRLARGTEPLQEAVDAAADKALAALQRERESRRIDSHAGCHVALHEALTALLALEALVTRCGGFMRMDDQEVLFRARQMLDKHGRRQTTDERAASAAHLAKVVTP